MKNIWMTITRHGEAAPLMDLLKLEQDDVSAIVVGSKQLAEEVSSFVKEVKLIETEASADNYAQAVADLLAEKDANLVVAAASSANRGIAGAYSVKQEKTLVSNIIEVDGEGNEINVKRSAVDGKEIEVLKVPAGSFLLINPLDFKLQDYEINPQVNHIEGLDISGDAAVEYLEVTPIQASSLTKAERIVSVGIGGAKEELFSQAEQLSEEIGAELGCSMPVATEYMLLPHDHYVGISGCKVAPKLYIALGISGTTPHRNGVNNAKTIVVINKDPNAPFFKNADYGIVGNLEEVLPALLEELK